MHDAPKIIAKSECVCFSRSILVKLVLKTSLDVVIDDINVLIPVWPRVLVVEAYGMTKLVDHNTIVDTARSQ